MGGKVLRIQPLVVRRIPIAALASICKRLLSVSLQRSIHPRRSARASCGKLIFPKCVQMFIVFIEVQWCLIVLIRILYKYTNKVQVQSEVRATQSTPLLRPLLVQYKRPRMNTNAVEMLLEMEKTKLFFFQLFLSHSCNLRCAHKSGRRTR